MQDQNYLDIQVASATAKRGSDLRDQRNRRSGVTPHCIAVAAALAVTAHGLSIARATPAPAPAVSVQAAQEILIAGKVPTSCVNPADASTPARSNAELISCMIAHAFRRDAKARTVALGLYRDTGTVAGVGSAELMDGGYRGTIRLLPALPTGEYRQHLRWVVAAASEFDDFFSGFTRAPNYRWRGLRLRFVRSVAKRTPSAYAQGWSVTYNVRGSLLGSAAGVSETLFHEIFHLNDEDHGDWSSRALANDYAAILARCSPQLTRACLAPYAPGTTTVRGGTYYAFQQNNGDSVREYAAELAVRYYQEHRELAATGNLTRAAFKCGPPENVRAWTALVDEFFAGIDRIAPCS